MSKPLQVGVIQPDLHLPYEDKRAFKLFLKVAAILQPDFYVSLGDFCDLYSVSAHDNRDPKRSRFLEEELSYAREKLDQIEQEVKPKRKIFLEGNHEWRLQRYLCNKAPELYETIKLDEILKLKEKGWEYVPYHRHLRIGKLYCCHDAGRSGKYAHADAAAAYGGNVLMGHSHRLGSVYTNTVRGKCHLGASCGWLGDPNQIDYLHDARAKADWQTGFAVVFLEPSTGNVHVQLVPIIDYKCVVGAVLFSL